MKKILLGALLAAVAPSTANAAIIISEDFENGTGAFTLSGNAYVANGALYNPCCGTPVDNPNNFVAFGGGNQPSGLASASFRTALGSTYTVNFDYGALGGGSEPLTFTVGGQTFTFNPVADNSIALTSTSFTFTGSGDPTSLVVTSGGVNNVDAIVDNISVVGAAVPEPTTWALMILGIGAVGGAMRRRSAKGRTTTASLRFA